MCIKDDKQRRLNMMVLEGLLQHTFPKQSHEEGLLVT